MKKNRSEKMAEQLLDLDEKLLDRAYEIDNAEKLKQYERSKKTKSGKPLLFRPKFLKCAALVACLAILFGVCSALFLPAMKGGEPTVVPSFGESGSSKGSNQPPIESDYINIEDSVFDSFDEVNFFAGLKLLSEAEAASAARYSSPVDAEAPILAAVAGNEPESRRVSRQIRYKKSTTTEPEEKEPRPDVINCPEYWGRDVSRFRMRIVTAVYCSIEVTEQDEFLAAKVGTGRVEVMITDLCFADSTYRTGVITFKNGDRYFSCLSEDDRGLDGDLSFISAFFIKGFYFCKATEEEVEFHVNRKERWTEATRPTVYNGVETISWSPVDYDVPTKEYHPLTVIPEPARVSREVYEFTLREFDEYYRCIMDEGGDLSELLRKDSPEQHLGISFNKGTVIKSELGVGYEKVEMADDGSGRVYLVPVEDAYKALLSGDTTNMAEIIVTGDRLYIEIEGAGLLDPDLDKAQAYRKNENGEYVSEKFDCHDSLGCWLYGYRYDPNLMHVLTPGEWYITFTVVWFQRNIYSTGQVIERHCSEYLIKINVE